MSARSRAHPWFGRGWARPAPPPERAFWDACQEWGDGFLASLLGDDDYVYAARVAVPALTAYLRMPEAGTLGPLRARQPDERELVWWPGGRIADIGFGPSIFFPAAWYWDRVDSD